DGLAFEPGGGDAIGEFGGGGEGLAVGGDFQCAGVESVSVVGGLAGGNVDRLDRDGFVENKRKVIVGGGVLAGGEKGVGIAIEGELLDGDGGGVWRLAELAVALGIEGGGECGVDDSTERRIGGGRWRGAARKERGDEE